MRMRFILSETGTNLRRNLSMLLSLMLVTFISFLFIGASVLTQAQITKAKGDWYDKVEVVVWLCPDGTSQSANCASGKCRLRPKSRPCRRPSATSSTMWCPTSTM